MANIVATQKESGVAKAITFTLTTASDTLDVKTGMLIIRNDSGSSASLVIDGDGAPNNYVAGYGKVNATSGYTLTVAAGAIGFIDLQDIAKYLLGTVTVTGGGANIFAAVIQ